LKYDSLPSSVTLNALAAFLGYSSWMGLKSQQQLNKKIEVKTEVEVVEKSSSFFKRKVWPVTAAVVGISAILAFTFLSGRSVHPLKNEKEIVFKSIYYMPGFFRAKLILDGKTIKEHDLFIKSDKWMATIDHQPVPTYVKKEDMLLNDKMEVSKNVLNKIKTITKPTWLTYHLVKPFNGLQSDNFILESSIKNSFAEGPAVCKTGKIFVLCSKGAFIIPFSIPGCISDVNLKVNDVYLPGKSNDLSAFSADLSDWANVKVEVKKRVMKIFLNEKLIRQETYKEDAGEVVGLRFSFLGAGVVKNVKLVNEKGEDVYNK